MALLCNTDGWLSGIKVSGNVRGSPKSFLLLGNAFVDLRSQKKVVEGQNLIDARRVRRSRADADTFLHQIGNV